MTDIPQDQVEAVAKAICFRPDWPCGECHGKAERAIRVLTPMIAEECAELAITTGAGSGVVNGAHVARRIAAALRSRFVRSVKGAVT